jgi:glycosyl hydrolase family 43
MKEVLRYPSKLTLFARLAVVGTILAILFVSYFLTTAQSATFRNPLNNGGADPWMTYFNGNYYLATTWGDPSVGLTMRRAPTIAALKAATPVRIWQDSTASRCCNYWAPEFHRTWRRAGSL